MFLPKRTLFLTALILATQPTFSQSSADQQDKDFEQKQRIYGTKHPWENTAPYGTQYTPPQAGAGTPSDSDKPAEPAKPPKKATTKKSVKQKKAVHKKVVQKSKTTKPKP
jgi:hypothetical protein